MPWLQIRQDDLRVGMYIKLDHRWTEHPFLRNRFKISSQDEVGIIRTHGLTRIWFDPERSAIKLPETAEPGESGARAAEPDEPPAERLEEKGKALQVEKQAEADSFESHQVLLRRAEGAYRDLGKQCSVMLAMLNVEDPGGYEMACRIVDAMMGLLEERSVALSLVGTSSRREPGLVLATQSLSVGSMAILTGKTLRLDAPEMRWLGLGGLLHNIGWLRLPPQIAAAHSSLRRSDQAAVRQYPALGKAILEALSDVPREVIDIVHRHREHLDGSGYPVGWVQPGIALAARIVGTAAEYLLLTDDEDEQLRSTPTRALARLYADMNSQFGSDAVEPFIATMTVFPPGSFVELSDGEIGMVVKSNSIERTRPVVRIHEPGASADDPGLVNLERERSLSILKCLDPAYLHPDVVAHFGGARPGSLSLAGA